MRMRTWWNLEAGCDSVFSSSPTPSVLTTSTGTVIRICYSSCTHARILDATMLGMQGLRLASPPRDGASLFPSLALEFDKVWKSGPPLRLYNIYKLLLTCRLAAYFCDEYEILISLHVALDWSYRSWLLR